jgi:hypothetical protein
LDKIKKIWLLTMFLFKFPRLAQDGETLTAASKWVDENPSGSCSGGARDALEAACQKELPDRTAKQVKTLIMNLLRKLRDDKGIGLIQARKKRKIGEPSSRANIAVRHPKNKQRP